MKKVCMLALAFLVALCGCTAAAANSQISEPLPSSASSQALSEVSSLTAPTSSQAKEPTVTGDVTRLTGHDDPILKSLTESPPPPSVFGNLELKVTSDKVILFDTAAQKNLKVFNITECVESNEFHEDGFENARFVASGKKVAISYHEYESKHLLLYNVETGEVTDRYMGQSNFSDKGMAYLGSNSSGKQTVCFWNFYSNTVSEYETPYKGGIVDVDITCAVTGTNFAAVKVYTNPYQEDNEMILYSLDLTREGVQPVIVAQTNGALSIDHVYDNGQIHFKTYIPNIDNITVDYITNVK